jgi:D-alanine-D-alanine ligase
LPAIRIATDSEFYDFNAKYNSNQTRYYCPSGLSKNRECELLDLCMKAFNSLDCRGWGRVDVMTDENGAFYLLEVNTVPGMTSHSLVPKAANSADISFDQLVLRIIEASL